MREFTFAIDCDDVLRDIIKNMIDVYNKEYKDNKTISDLTEWGVDNIFPKIKETTGSTASDYFFLTHSKEVFSDSKVISGAKDAIEKLRKFGKVIIVSYQKNDENRGRTLEWLSENNIEYDGLCFLKDKTLIHADYLIDDNDWNFNGCNCKHGILINQPYNININLNELKNKSNCKTIDRFPSLKSFADWFESNIKIFEKYEY